jgi:hypothetical protein
VRSLWPYTFGGKKVSSSIGKGIQPIRWIYELNLCLSIIINGSLSFLLAVTSSEVRFRTRYAIYSPFSDLVYCFEFFTV